MRECEAYRSLGESRGGGDSLRQEKVEGNHTERKEMDRLFLSIALAAVFCWIKKKGKRKDEEDVEEEEEKTIDKRSRKRNWSNLDIPSGFSSGVEIKLAFSCSFPFFFFCKGWGRRNWVDVFFFLFAQHTHTRTDKFSWLKSCNKPRETWNNRLCTPAAFLALLTLNNNNTISKPDSFEYQGSQPSWMRQDSERLHLLTGHTHTRNGKKKPKKISRQKQDLWNVEKTSETWDRLRTVGRSDRTLINFWKDYLSILCIKRAIIRCRLVRRRKIGRRLTSNEKLVMAKNHVLNRTRDG